MPVPRAEAPASESLSPESEAAQAAPRGASAAFRLRIPPGELAFGMGSDPPMHHRLPPMA